MDTIRTGTADACIASLAEATARGIPEVIMAHGDEFRCSDGRYVGIGQARASGPGGGTLPGCYVLSVWNDSGPLQSYELDARGLTRRRTAVA